MSSLLVLAAFTAGSVVSATQEIRVSRVVGSRENSFSKIRISVIANSTSSSALKDSYDYSAQFQNSWTNFYLSTKIVDVIPGQENIIAVGSDQVKVKVPAAREGVLGVVVADVCNSLSQYCGYGSVYKVDARLPEILNAVASDSAVDFYGIFGDNFYDQTGAATTLFYDQVGADLKSKFLVTANGNHDMWVRGSPDLYQQGLDQLGNGYIQYYGQDSVASVKTFPYDFSVLPTSSEALPAAANFFSYNLLGNTGFITFSGAHSYSSQSSLFEEACSYFSGIGDDVSFIVLAGHWNMPGDGDKDASTPAVYAKLTSADSQCSGIKSKLRYFEGHVHENKVVVPDVGFMVGSNGMTDSFDMSSNEWGVTIVDTSSDSFKVYYFPLMGITSATKTTQDSVVSFDNYQTVLDCFKSKGVRGCYSLAKGWTSVSVV